MTQNDVVLGPYQEFFFSTPRPTIQADGFLRVFQVPSHLPPEVYASFFAEFARQHDVMRTCFHKAAQWQARLEPRLNVDQFFSTESLDLTAPSEFSKQIGDVCKKMIAAIDVGKAPLFRVSHVRASTTSTRLIVFIHHLLIDQFSLTRLERSLSRFLESTPDGTRPALPSDVGQSSYLSWAAAIREEISRAKEELTYWSTVHAGSAIDFKPDHPGAPNLAASEGWVDIDFSSRRGEAILKKGIDLCAISALTIALGQSFGRGRHRLYVHSLGRRVAWGGIGASQIVGALATLYPLVTSSAAALPLATLNDTREAIIAVPNFGEMWGVLKSGVDKAATHAFLEARAGSPMITTRYNALGATGVSTTEGPLVRMPSEESAGWPPPSPEDVRRAEVELHSTYQGTDVKYSLLFSKARVNEDTIRRFSEFFEQAIDDITQ